MNAFADIAAEWRKAGLLPPEGTPVPKPSEYDPAAYIRQQRLAKWKEYCPPEFQKPIERDKIPNLKAWDEADQWNGTHPGVWLWSHDTGLAKSRMLWRLFGRLHVKQAKNVTRITGFHLAEEYHDCLNKNATYFFYRNVMGYEVVMLDDLDKMKLPEETDGFAEKNEAARNARMLRELFDKFYEAHTPVLVTANEPIAWFEERIGPSGARRMREVCREISFQ